MKTPSMENDTLMQLITFLSKSIGFSTQYNPPSLVQGPSTSPPAAFVFERRPRSKSASSASSSSSDDSFKDFDTNSGSPSLIDSFLDFFTQRPTDLGDVMFSLSYLPTAERLTVVMVKARNIKWSQCKDAGDCFVKVYLLQNGKKVAKKKTSTKRGEQNPIFNEAMIFSVPSSALQTVQLRVTVVEHFRNSKLYSVGHVVVGSQVTGTELTHWNQMMTSLRKPVAMWHALRK